jgi:hypothetical protein
MNSLANLFLTSLLLTFFLFYSFCFFLFKFSKLKDTEEMRGGGVVGPGDNRISTDTTVPEIEGRVGCEQ